MRREHFGVECRACGEALAVCEAARMRDRLDLRRLTDAERVSVLDFYRRHDGHDVEPVLFEIQTVGAA